VSPVVAVAVAAAHGADRAASAVRKLGHGRSSAATRSASAAVFRRRSSLSTNLQTELTGAARRRTAGGRPFRYPAASTAMRALAPSSCPRAPPPPLKPQPPPLPNPAGAPPHLVPSQRNRGVRFGRSREQSPSRPGWMRMNAPLPGNVLSAIYRAKRRLGMG